jgi:hypothetical protein
MPGQRQRLSLRILPDFLENIAATADDVRHAYRLFLLREPDKSGLDHYLKKIVTEGMTTRQLAAEFLGSAEFAKTHGRADDELRLTLEKSPKLVSQPCTMALLESQNFRYWGQRLRERPLRPHRKMWEWCYIVQALNERGCLVQGARGLGFAVGSEPLSALFASIGCSVTATDLDLAAAAAGGWVSTHEHAADLATLNERGICDDETFAMNTRFLNVDMCEIPSTLQGFDFLWSSCAIEHLGCLNESMDFVVKAMSCLKYGGIAIHTTEFNCDSEVDTIEMGKDVIFRKRDLIELCDKLKHHNYTVEELDFSMGTSQADRFVDEWPYKGASHLKLRIGGFASTSFGIIVRKTGNSGSEILPASSGG